MSNLIGDVIITVAPIIASAFALWTVLKERRTRRRKIEHPMHGVFPVSAPSAKDREKILRQMLLSIETDNKQISEMERTVNRVLMSPPAAEPVPRMHDQLSSMVPPIALKL
jgi:hypothetical protein